MYKIKKEDLTALFRAIAAEQELYVPVKTAGKVNFGPWSEDAEVDIDTLKSVKSPKDVSSPRVKISILVNGKDASSKSSRKR